MESSGDLEMEVGVEDGAGVATVAAEVDWGERAGVDFDFFLRWSRRFLGLSD